MRRKPDHDQLIPSSGRRGGREMKHLFFEARPADRGELAAARTHFPIIKIARRAADKTCGQSHGKATVSGDRCLGQGAAIKNQTRPHTAVTWGALNSTTDEHNAPHDLSILTQEATIVREKDICPRTRKSARRASKRLSRLVGGIKERKEKAPVEHRMEK